MPLGDERALLRLVTAATSLDTLKAVAVTVGTFCRAIQQPWTRQLDCSIEIIGAVAQQPMSRLSLKPSSHNAPCVNRTRVFSLED